MECLINSLIYLLAVVGIVFTTMSFWEVVRLKNNEIYDYKIQGENNIENNRIDIVIKIKDLDDETLKLIERIKSGDKIDLKEVASNILIQKTNKV